MAVLSTPYNYAAHGITPPTADGVILGDRSNSPGSSGGNTTGVNSGNPADVYFSDLSVVLTAPPPITGWLSTGSGNWNSTANWDTGIPNAVGEEADFFNTISQASTVYTNSPITLSTLHFNNGNTIEITGTGSLTLQAPAGSSALVQVDQNTDIINLPLTLASNTLFNASGGNLVISNPLTLNAGVTLTQSGNITYQSTITLGAGANFDFGAGTTNIGSLSLAGGSKASFPADAKAAAQIGQLGLGAGSSMDLGQSTLTIDYGSNADPIQSISSYLQSGYNSGAWNGPGIESSFVAAHPGYGIGYADGADGVVAGLPAGEIEVTPTLLGDATLSGSVTFGDFQILAAHFGAAGSWDEGNFLYGSTINAADLATLAANIPSASLTSGQLASMDTFAAGLGDTLVPSGVGFQLVSVPEPATVGLLSLGGIGLLNRRRRKA
jgi:hypothetical protein